MSRGKANIDHQQHDLELRAEDVQLLSDADAVAAFFGRLGYDTNPRTVQTPGNLGITSENTLRRIRKIELIADNEGLLQVYLFQLPTVTVADARALATAFRNRVGNFLLVLTADFERIDFVFLEKYLPIDQDRSIAQPQVKVRPRTLSLERRKPERLQLRVLGRFTWTETDALAQYEKLLAAYALAYWSEEYFNNRALFSDYFLKERLTDPEEFPEWKEDPKPAYNRLRQIYQLAAPNLAGAGKTPLQRDLIEPAFTELGFDLERSGKNDRPEEPDYRLYAANHKTGDAPLALCLAYPWHRFLDGKDDRRDADTPEHNPGQRVVSLLETGEAPWIILTNGRLWRLYSPSAPSRASNFYEVDLGDALGQTAPFAGEPADAFRYFWLLFRRASFEAGAVPEAPAPSLLDRLFHGSRAFAARLGESLKDRVFEQIFQVLADGFITDIRHREGKDAALSQERLDEIFQGVLTLLYRLLFLLYAEARDLLPVRETREYFDASLTRLKSEIELAAGPIRDDEREKLYDHYRTSSTALYDRLKRLFDVIDRGDSDLSVPRYNGGLFLSKVSDDDGSTEAAAARFLNKNKVPDPFLAHALDLLSRDEDPKQHKLVPVDFKSLGVRQLGSIYEGLLEFKLRIASEKKAIVKEKARDVYVPFKDLSERERDRVESQERIVKRGGLYLENDKGERKATGSYYTPDHIVSYIVEHAAGPVVREKFEGMRTRLREAEHWHRQAVSNAKAKGEHPNKYESGPAVETKWYMLVNDLFDLKILDPAMGSGHFLVETVDYITDKMLAFLNSFPWNPAAAHLDLVRQTILDEMDTQQISIDQRRLTDVNLLKRHVLKRCIYGVDLNPMAVELAKVSLWLHCFTLGAPLSFLDHHMRCGNSLIGVYVADVQQALGGGQSGQARLFGSQFAGLMLATDLMRHVGELSDVTTAQLDESKTEYKRASEALGPFKRLMDVYTSQWFRNGKSRKLLTEAREVAFLATEKSAAVLKALAQHASKMPGPLNKEEQEIIEQTVRSSSHKRFFHWELEFPEVFYGPRAGTERIITRLDGAGFDAVIGNPPYDVLSNEELGYDVSPDLAFFRSQVTYSPALEGKSNLFKLFVCRSYTETSSSGFLSLIVPMALLGDQQTAGTRRLLLESAGPVVFEAFPQKDDPRNRVFEEAKLATCVFVARKRPTGEQFTVRTHRNAEISNDGVCVKMSPLDLLRLNGAGAIPTCSQRDWHIVSVLLTSTSAERLRDYCEAFQGEINETTDGKRGFVSYDSSVGPLVLRGSMICLYALRDASQGEPMYLREQKYLKGKPDSLKAWHHQGRRMGWQESSALNNFRRIIAAPIPKGAYCNHKINYIPEKSSKLPLDFVLALLNSQLSDWFFRLQSTNAAVSHYQVLELLAPRVEGDTSRPVAGCTHLIDAGRWNDLENCLCAPLRQPGIMPGEVVASIADLSRHVQKLEAKRVLKSRSERSHLGPESQTIQDLIDRTFFCCFGLSRDDESYIETRLSEML